MRAFSAKHCIVFLLMAIVGCTIDVTTKAWMFNRLGIPGPDSHIWWVWEDVFGFQTSLNEGALFGFGQGMTTVFAGLSILAAVGILGWFLFAGASHDWLLTIALGCIMVGILGNLYDRLGLPGLKWNGLYPPHSPHNLGESVYAVRDFILVMIGPWRWPNFNIADCHLVCGAGMLVLHAMLSKTPVDSEEEVAEAVEEPKS